MTHQCQCQSGGCASNSQAEPFELSCAEREAIEHEKGHYEDARAASIEALKIVQKARGWVPDGAIHAIARQLGIPASDVEGVATFYSQIFRQPVGRHIIRLCDSVVCFITGYQSVLQALESKLGIGLGQTTADGRFTLLPVCCLGNCDKGPTLMIDDDTHAFGSGEAITLADLERLLEHYP
ncbi:MAG: NADH-quinone oxidoreductase subunit NuoE [Aeromonadaceae bacterium]